MCVEFLCLEVSVLLTIAGFPFLRLSTERYYLTASKFRINPGSIARTPVLILIYIPILTLASLIAISLHSDYALAP